MADIRLPPNQHFRPIPNLLIPTLEHSTYINLSILKPLLQIVIDSLIRDLTDQRKIRHADLLLLCALKHRFPDLRLASSAAAGRLGITGFLLAAGALRDRLAE